MATLPAEFEKWWKQTKGLAEFRGVSEAAALALWQRAGGKVEVKEEEEGEPLPEAFNSFWENARHLAEFRGCTMAAAYAAWLDGRASYIKEPSITAKVPTVSERVKANKRVSVPPPLPVETNPVSGS